MSIQDRIGQSQWLAARRFALGQAVPADADLAIQRMRDAANAGIEAGEGDFAYQFGRILATGIYYSDMEDESGMPEHTTIPRDMKEAISWFRKASDVGHPYAKLFLELSADESIQEGEMFRRMAAESDSNWTYYEHPWLVAGCRLGDAEACMDLSFCIWDRWPWHTEHWEERVVAYQKGRELGARHRAIVWYNGDKGFSEEFQIRKAKAGHLPSQIDLGLRYAGSARHVEAYAWLRTALQTKKRWQQIQLTTVHREDANRGTAALWFLEKALEEHELDAAKSLANEFIGKFQPRRIGIIRRMMWFFDGLSDFAKGPQ